MEYFYEFQEWLQETRLYQEILQELPVPLNNIYFDSLIILGLAAYLIYRILDAIWYACRRRRIRKRKERDRKQQLQREKEMMYRELQVQQKEEKVGRFLDYMEMIAARRMGQTDGYENRNITGKHGKRIGRKNFFLEKKNEPGFSDSEYPEASDYDVVMEAVVYDAEQDSEISRKQRAAQEQMYTRINELDEAIKVRIVDETVEVTVDECDPVLEKRKEKARRKDEKERRKAEKRKMRQQEGKGVWRILKKK